MPVTDHPRCTLAPSRERSVLHRHPWIFSGAIARIDGQPEPGQLVTVYAANGHRLGMGFYNPHSQIRLRMVIFGDDSFSLEVFARRLAAAAELRSRLLPANLTAQRLVNSDGDGLPGLVVDRYDNVLVVQFYTLGMARLRASMVELLQHTFTPTAIIERSDSPTLKEEGLTPTSGVVWGQVPPSIEVVENGVRFEVDCLAGQKTGLFLDQRDNRAKVAELAAGKELLNCFSYTGGFSLAAACRGAITTSVEISGDAQRQAHKNFVLNRLDPAAHRFVQADVFEYLRAPQSPYPFIVLDPPAFIKHRSHLDKGTRAYKDINRLALGHLAPGGLLLTCSCSQHLSWDLFQKVLFAAARDSDRTVQVLGRYSQPLDHSFSIYHPEGEYLKTFLLRVTD